MHFEPVKFLQAEANQRKTNILRNIMCIDPTTFDPALIVISSYKCQLVIFFSSLLCMCKQPTLFYAGGVTIDIIPYGTGLEAYYMQASKVSKIVCTCIKNVVVSFGVCLSASCIH